MIRTNDRSAARAGSLDAAERATGLETVPWSVPAMGVRRLVRPPRTGGPLARLSRREVEVLTMVAPGLAEPTIADRLAISRGILEWYVRRILVKLGMAESPAGDRRVLAVPTCLGASADAAS